MKTEPGAIVIGGHFQGLGVVRALGRNGVEVAVLDKEMCLSRYSRYTTRFYHTPDIMDDSAYLNYMVRLAAEKGLKGWVVYPTDDETVGFLSRHKSSLDNYFRLFTPEWDVIKYTYDKSLSYRLATKLGIPIPKTSYPQSADDLEKVDIPFPVIIKPAVMRSFFRRTGKKVFRALNRKELHDYYRKAAEVIPENEILIQEEIPDVSRNLYSYCPFFKNGKTIGQVTAQRLRQHPMDFGQASTYAVSMKIDALEDLGNRFLSEINYYGIGEVEFIKDPRDGMFKFLEINPRIWGWHTLAVRSGVNLPLMVYKDLTGKRVEAEHFTEGKIWSRLITDLATVASEIVKGRMSFSDYVTSMRGDKEWAVMSKDDPLPFFVELLMLPYLWLKRGF